MRYILVLAVAGLLLSGCAATGESKTTRGAESDSALAKDILTHSISIPTVEGRGRVPELAAYYAKILTRAGFADDDIVITPLGETAMLSATLRGRVTGKPILLIAHMDVVEANPADWTRDPFTPIEENGYIFGRGSKDNKFSAAMMVTTMAKLKREHYQPHQDVVLLITGDEETTGKTAQVLVDQYKNAALVLNGDAGGGVISDDGKARYYSIQAAEKSYADFEIEFTNPGGHSSRPTKPNAITQLSNALARIGAYDFAAQRSELTMESLKMVAQQVEPDLGAAMKRFIADPNDADALATIRANPEYIGQIGTTCVPTLVNAGHAINALPQRATANINCRIFPGVPVEDVQAEIARVIDDSAATIRIAWRPTISPASPLRKDVIDAVTAAVRTDHPGLPIIPSMSAYGTDGVFFRAAGKHTYGVSGLYMRASDDFAHGLNERVPVAAIPGALAHWERIIRTLTKAP